MNSATYDDEVIQLASNFVGSFTPFTIKKEALKLKGVKNFRIILTEDKKLEFIAKLHSTKMSEGAMTMVFVNTKKNAEKLQTKLATKDVKSNILIGGIENKDRDQIIDDFRKLKFKCLISTNVLARGIDVPEVDLVINYDVPMVIDCGFKHPDYANFMHRVGRTGRFGTDGLSLTMISETDEHEEEFVDLIEKHYDIKITTLNNFQDLKTIFNEMRAKANVLFQM